MEGVADRLDLGTGQFPNMVGPGRVGADPICDQETLLVLTVGIVVAVAPIFKPITSSPRRWIREGEMLEPRSDA